MTARDDVHCLHCQGTEFTVEVSRLSTKWDARSHLVDLYICNGCRFVMTFYDKKSWVTNR